MKIPYRKEVTEVNINWIKDVRQDGHKISELFDKIIVWVISLSTGAIVLIFSNLDKLKFVDSKTINGTLLFLVISVICGIVGRILFAIASYLSNMLISQFDFILRIRETEPKSRALVGDETSELIYAYLIEDFELEEQNILGRKKINPVEKHNQIDADARDFYKKMSTYFDEEFKKRLIEIHEITEFSLGFKSGYFRNKKFKNNRVRGITMRSSSFLSNVMYLISISSLGGSILYFFIKYIK